MLVGWQLHYLVKLIALIASREKADSASKMFPSPSAVVDKTVSQLLEHVAALKHFQRDLEKEERRVDDVISDLLLCKCEAVLQGKLSFFYPNIVVSKTGNNDGGFDENCKLADYEERILDRFRRDQKKLEAGEITTLYIHCRDFMVYFTSS
jgi:hypothetical protein